MPNAATSYVLICPSINKLSYGIVALAFLATNLPAYAAGPHYVFAHYMVCYANYGATLQGFKQEIQDAQSAGIDGFALNVGEWNGPDTYYKTRVELLYQAAESLNTGFKFFFSVDMAVTNDIVEMVSAYACRNNSFYYNGRLVVSSFCGNGLNWATGVFRPLQTRGISNVFFVPFFTAEVGGWKDLNMGATNLLAKYGSLLDGFFEFSAGVPKDAINLNTAYGQACKKVGKLFMAGCSPNYWGCCQPSSGRPYFENQGGEGIMAEWNWIIQNQPDWVEIITWNDLNESTYINPLPNPDQNNQSAVKRFSHAGYLELTKRYISWYKTGQQPGLNTDSLFYFYRTHATNAVAANADDVPVTSFLGDVQDVIYTTVILTSPANLEIESGSTKTTNSFPAGISNARIPFSAGAQKFTLRRNGLQLLTVKGVEIQEQIKNYNYFTASGYAYLPTLLIPPGNLKATGN